MINTAVVGLGSNIRPQTNIKKAVQTLRRDFTITKKSRFVRTKPIGNIKQADFINGALLVKTTLNYNSFRKNLKNIEKELGRKRAKNKFGPRSIDLDIIVWNKTITDRDFYKRPFLKKAVLSLLPRLRFKK